MSAENDFCMCLSGSHLSKSGIRFLETADEELGNVQITQETVIQRSEALKTDMAPGPGTYIRLHTRRIGWKLERFAKIWLHYGEIPEDGGVVNSTPLLYKTMSGDVGGNC